MLRLIPARWISPLIIDCYGRLITCVFACFLVSIQWTYTARSNLTIYANSNKDSWQVQVDKRTSSGWLLPHSCLFCELTLVSSDADRLWF